MKTFAILIILVLAIPFVSVQNVSYGQELSSFTTNNAINVNGSSFVVPYGITGGKLVSVNTDIPSKSLIISIQSTGIGILNMTLPRTLIDARQDGDDTHFTVLVNNHGTNYKEIESYAYRTLSVPFQVGAEKIQIIGTQMLTQSSNSSANTIPVIKAQYTNNSPDIDGKWTTPSEWNETEAMGLEKNDSKMYILAQHDFNFVYVMADVVSDHTTPSDSQFMRYNFLMIFDRDNYQEDTTLGSKEIDVGTSFAYVNGTQISSNFGSHVWTYDNQSNAVDVVTPFGYNSSVGFSSTNDPFDSSHDHRIYEFRVPLSLLHKSDKYGFSLQAHACHSQDLASRCTPIYLLAWPPSVIMSVPSSHGILELTNESSVQPVEVTVLNNLQYMIIGIIVIAIMVGIAVYMIARKRRMKLEQ
jgi:hypothetical protein